MPQCLYAMAPVPYAVEQDFTRRRLQNPVVDNFFQFLRQGNYRAAEQTLAAI